MGHVQLTRSQNSGNSGLHSQNIIHYFTPVSSMSLSFN